MIKKVFWVSLVFFVLTLIFLGVYQFAFKHNVNNPVADPEKKADYEAKARAEEENVPTQSLAFSTFLNEVIAFPGVERDNLFYYSLRDKTIKRITFSGEESAVVMQSFTGEVKRLVYSPTFQGAQALIEQDGKRLWYYLNFRSQTASAMKEGITRLSWNTLGDSIFYQYTDPKTGRQSLNMASFNGSNWRQLADLGQSDSFLATIPQSSRVSFWPKPNGLEATHLESIGMNSDIRTVLGENRFGSDYLWSPNGSLVIVSSLAAKGDVVPTLGIMNDTGGEYRDLHIPTLANKVAWSRDNQTIYYALPGAFPTGTILPNDYFSKPLYTKDTFWKMNLKTGKRERLVPLGEMNQAFDATDLFLAPDETSLFFIERQSNRLYRIEL